MLEDKTLRKQVLLQELFPPPLQDAFSIYFKLRRNFSHPCKQDENFCDYDNDFCADKRLDYFYNNQSIYRSSTE